MYLYVTSNLWTRSTLLLFTAQLSVQPFHTMKEHESVKGISDWFMNLKNKLARFSFISFISVLLPFCKKLGIFSPPSVAGLVSLSSVCRLISMDLELFTSRNLALAGFGGQLGYFWPCKQHLFLLALSGKSWVQHWECSPKEPQPSAMCCFHGANPRVPRDRWLFIRQNAGKATHRVSRNWNGMRAGPLFCPPEKCKHRNWWLHLKPHLSPPSWTGAFLSTPLPWGFSNKSQDQLLLCCVMNLLAGGLTPKRVKRRRTNAMGSQGLYLHTLTCQCWSITLCSPHLNGDVSVCKEHTWKRRAECGSMSC